MAGFLLDTNVVSELVRPGPARPVLDWVGGQAPDQLMLSAISIGELTRGIARLAPGRRRRILQRWIDVDLEREFAGRILPFDHATAVVWGQLMGDGDRAGRPRPAIDAQLAATALRHRLAVVTRNTADFEGLGITVIDPWTN